MKVAQDARLTDLKTFESCLSDAAVEARVMEDKAMGDKLGVDGTPTFLINDLKFSGYPGKGKLSELVRKALKARVL